jgi:magnesium transporter
MTDEQAYAPTAVIDAITQSLNSRDLTRLAAAAGKLTTRQLVDALERLSARGRAVGAKLPGLLGHLSSDARHGRNASGLPAL